MASKKVYILPLAIAGLRRDYTCGACEGEEIVETTNLRKQGRDNRCW